MELVRALCERIRVPADCRELAIAVARDHGNVHRALELRAATVVELLERVDAFRRPERFAEFLQACECDFRGRPGYESRAFPAAAYLAQALAAARGSRCRGDCTRSGARADTRCGIPCASRCGRCLAQATTFEGETMPYSEQTVQSVRPWSDKTFSFTLSRPQDFAFENGEFVTIGLKREGRLVARAYSIVSTARPRLSGIPQHPCAGRPAHQPAGPNPSRRQRVGQQQGHRLAHAQSCVAGAHAVHACHRHRAGAVHEPDPRSRTLCAL